jgi:hypothetical protein
VDFGTTAGFRDHARLQSRPLKVSEGDDTPPGHTFPIEFLGNDPVRLQPSTHWTSDSRIFNTVYTHYAMRKLRAA